MVLCLGFNFVYKSILACCAELLGELTRMTILGAQLPNFMRRIAVDDNDVVTHFESTNLLRLATLWLTQCQRPPQKF